MADTITRLQRIAELADKDRKANRLIALTCITLMSVTLFNINQPVEAIPAKEIIKTVEKPLPVISSTLQFVKVPEIKWRTKVVYKTVRRNSVKVKYITRVIEKYTPEIDSSCPKGFIRNSKDTCYSTAKKQIIFL